MFKRLFGRRANGGFTLAEMVVSCALLGILAVGLTAFMAPVLNSASEAKVNARASLLAETIEGYISRSTMNAYRIAIYENVNPSMVAGSISDDVGLATGCVASDSNLAEMKAFVNADSAHYEMRCISVRWDTTINKYILKNETFGSDGLTLEGSKSYPVFEDCFYLHLYPTIKFKKVQKAKETGSSSSSEGESGTPTPAVGYVDALKTTVSVYPDQTTENFTFQGVGYTDYLNIRNKLINQSGDNKFYDIKKVNETETYDHPETYIYYILRKPISSTTPTT